MMPHRKPFFLVLTAFLAFQLSGCESTKATGFQPEQTASLAWDVCFSPKGGCTDLIVATIGQAKQSILVQAYSFTSQPIAEALVAAHGRGVKVQAILDKGQRSEDDSRAGLLLQAGVPVMIDAAHAIAHNKVMVIDDEVVITGSFNFTKGAEERNAENLLILRDKILAARYKQNWDKHESHAQPY